MSLPFDHPVRIVISSTPAHLPVVRGAVERAAELLGFGPECAAKIMLSTDEALTNIIRHAYDEQHDRPIEIELSALSEAEARGIRICLRDYGRRADPEKIRSRDLADIRPGGLGVHIMSECMDDLEYRPAEGGGTVLTMTKACPLQEEGIPQ